MDRVLADAARMGVPAPVFAEPPAPEIWEPHLPAWRAWCAISGQMRTVAVSTMESARILWLGLDYGAARAGLDLAGLEVSPDLWSDICAIESAAIEELNRRGR